MKTKFVQTSNVKRFLAAVSAVEQRAAPEATILLVSGDAGHGKSRTAKWWAVSAGAVFLRLKAAATPHWALTDLVTELGEMVPAASSEKLFAQIVGRLARAPQPIVVDEVENGLDNGARVLDTLRDVTDLVEVPLVFVGREYVWGKISRHKQIKSRVSARAEFSALPGEDVATLVADLCECPVHDEVVAEIARRSDGYVREIIKAIKNVERLGRRAGGGEVAPDMIRGEALTHDWQRSRRAAA